MNQDEYLKKIDAAIIEAGKIMDLDDLDPDKEDEYESEWENRYHCGVCVVRTVMEAIWPSVEEYVEALEKGKVDVPST
jgi:hypothetical protein